MLNTEAASQQAYKILTGTLETGRGILETKLTTSLPKKKKKKGPRTKDTIYHRSQPTLNH